MSGRFAISTPRAAPWRITVLGPLYEDRAAQLLQAVGGIAGSSAHGVILDIRDLWSWEQEAEERLAELLTHLRRQGNRCTWAADRPCTRALARRVCHRAGDRMSMVCDALDAATDALQGLDGRMDALLANAGIHAFGTPSSWSRFMIRPLLQKVPEASRAQVARSTAESIGLIAAVQLGARLASWKRRATARWGATLTSALFGLGTLWVGCRYCSEAYLLEANAAHLRDALELFALNDALVGTWMSLTDEELGGALEHATREQPPLQRLVSRFVRAMGPEPGNGEETELLGELGALCAVLAETTVGLDAAAPNTDPRRRKLVDGYLRARDRMPAVA